MYFGGSSPIQCHRDKEELGRSLAEGLAGTVHHAGEQQAVMSFGHSTLSVTAPALLWEAVLPLWAPSRDTRVSSRGSHLSLRQWQEGQYLAWMGGRDQPALRGTASQKVLLGFPMLGNRQPLLELRERES